MVIRVISDDVKSNYHEGMEEAKEGSSAPGTHWSTGGRAGGGNIWRLENQGKKKLPKNFILFLTDTQLGHAPLEHCSNDFHVQAFARELHHLSGKQATTPSSSGCLKVQNMSLIF